jgi:uncharacterized protein (DUF58 family)
VPDQDEDRFVPDQDENRSASDQVPELLDAATLRAIERLTLESLDAVIAGVAGPRASEMRGFGLEFADYRAYAPGDDLRQLDWHAYMRLRELLVKVGPLEGHLEVDLLIDVSRSMDSVLAGSVGARPSKLVHAQRVAAALGAVALLRADAVRTWGLSDGHAEPGARLGAPKMLALLERELSRLEPGRVTELAASLRSYRNAGAQADLSVMISDALVTASSLAEALRELGSGARASALVHVVDRGEAAPVPSGTVVLRDRETGRRLELSITRSMAAEYERRFERFCRAVEEACADAGVGYVRAPTDLAVLDLLSTSARSAGLVGGQL